MNKKVLILSGSPRRGGNSALLCGEFALGAQQSSNEVEIIRVAAKKIVPCSDAITAVRTTANVPTKTIWLKCCKR